MYLVNETDIQVMGDLFLSAAGEIRVLLVINLALEENLLLQFLLCSSTG